jgi:hypothetical protein
MPVLALEIKINKTLSDMTRYNAGTLDIKDYWEVDQTATNDIMSEFEGTTVEVVCPYCHNDPGKVEKCLDCNQTGSYEILYETKETK